MAITFPLFALRGGKTSGVEFAMFNLMKALHASARDVAVAHAGLDRLSPGIRDWIVANGIPADRYPYLGSKLVARFAEETLYGLGSKADQVVFPNYFLPPATPRIRQASAFIMDVQHRVFPQFFGAAKVRWMDMTIAHMLRKADRVLFISQFEFEQTQRFFGSAFAERGRVVHVAIDWTRFAEEPARPDLLPIGDRPFILSVSQQYPHKRLDLLLRAFAKLARRDPDVALVLTGRPAPGLLDAARSELDADAAGRIHFAGFVSDAELGHLYRRTSVFALPSVYEGFGMPAVEALSFGNPALLTDSTAVPEATMGLAHYLPSEAGPDEWADALGEMVRNPRTIAPAQVAALRARYEPVTIAGRLRRALND
jgi:glycosyltransferase involved in cell wall biosynthesis